MRFLCDLPLNRLYKYSVRVLLSKLYLYGIRGTPHNWFESYLHNRRQYVKIDSTKSSYENITCGIPQGSTLGPLLFLLYVNDLPNCVDNLSVRSFADDTNLFYSSDNLKQLESGLCQQNQIRLSSY